MINRNYIIHKANEIANSRANKGDSRPKYVIFKHSVVGLLSEAFLQHLYPSLHKIESMYYDLVSPNNIKIEVKSISKKQLSTNTWVKLTKVNTQQEVMLFDYIAVIIVDDYETVYNSFVNNDDNIIQFFEFLGFIHKDDYLNNRFISKYEPDRYIIKKSVLLSKIKTNIEV